MKRKILAAILIIFTHFCIYGQNAEPIDLVLVLNTSSGMSSSYENVNDYITGSFLSEFMRVGDTFHLIAFSGNQRLDVARQISSLGDVETIIGRMLLQYPVESGDNIGAAIAYAEKYVLSLPARPKKIVVVSTGGSEINSIVNSAKQRLNSTNTTLDFIQVTPGQPLTNLPKSGRSSGSTGQIAAVPPDSGQQPEVYDSGTAKRTETGPTTFVPIVQEEQKGIPPWLLILGLILLLLILGLIIFFALRRSGSSRGRFAGGSSRDEKFANHSEDLAKYAAAQNRQRTSPYNDRPSKADQNVIINPTGPLLLNLFVEEQSVSIGKRNIHSLKSGTSLTVGGRNSDFLIFLVPLPSNLGELQRNGSQLTFIPRKHKYFPDLGSNELRNCLNKTIRVISDKGYELRFRFEMYEDPLVALNRILYSIKVPG